MDQKDAGERDALLFTDRQHLRPVLDVVEPDGQVRQGDLDQGLLDLAVVDDALLVWVLHDRAEVTEGDVGELGHEHRVLPA